jgi:hypothetical protein
MWHPPQALKAQAPEPLPRFDESTSRVCGPAAVEPSAGAGASPAILTRGAPASNGCDRHGGAAIPAAAGATGDYGALPVLVAVAASPLDSTWREQQRYQPFTASAASLGPKTVSTSAAGAAAGPGGNPTRPSLAGRACYFLLGAGMLAAWNALITATDYFGAVYPVRG